MGLACLPLSGLGLALEDLGYVPAVRGAEAKHLLLWHTVHRLEDQVLEPLLLKLRVRGQQPLVEVVFGRKPELLDSWDKKGTEIRDQRQKLYRSTSQESPSDA